jgi:Fe-S-cluster containining protein
LTEKETEFLQEWEKLLGISWPKNACDRSGECCRGAAQTSPWKNLLKDAAQGHTTARSFLNQFIPYPNLEAAKAAAPDAVAASLAIIRQKGQAEEEVVFYHCRFLKDKSECQVYEDRPALCREFPESPFGAIPACCGYASTATHCLERIETLRRELEDLKKLQAMLELKKLNS